MMRSAAIFVVLLGVAFATPRIKRKAYELPDNIEILADSVRTTFSCTDDGYFADADNQCKIFHVCQRVTREDGGQGFAQYSFACGNHTVFNQLSMTCTYPEDSVPCPNAREFFYLNERLFQTDVPILVEQDVERAAPLIQRLRAKK